MPDFIDSAEAQQSIFQQTRLDLSPQKGILFDSV
jgi:hypothetical protein